MKRRKMF